jgi:hypothetical protein
MIRMDKNSELKLEAFDDVDGNKQVLFILEQGRVWVNNRDIDDAVHIVFDTDHLQIVSVGESAQYLVEQDLSEKVFAFQGSLRVDVRDLQSESLKIFESFTISQDEYIEISENDVRSLASFRSIEPVSKISQDVFALDWVLWNQKEDIASTNL